MIFLKVEAKDISPTAEILLIQVKVKEEIKIWSLSDYKDESDMLENFMQWFLDEEDKIIIGYNVLKFDIPLLLLKASKIYLFNKFFMKMNRSNVIDLFVILNYLGKGELRSMEYYTEKYETEKIMTGEDIIKVFESKNEEKLRSTAIRNLLGMEALFKKVFYS